ncbi:hypothetical protein F4V43_08975 [Paenibacillus spiritus]|uniref:Uncharacterized protein n=1 Tax=Paenibacillus spiritus TaxID=2496557 RepID=A0A5J5GA70_9BACL|nr:MULTISPECIES: hypothetical protein [Paenibacillus]KAA9005016.1 hypothetical protein F4V43_08975 [Paenibacillus spiritus]
MDKNDKGVKFKIKRIGRLDSNVANHVVSLYINAQTRVPLLMDPSKDLLELKEREVHYKGAKKENIKMYYYNKNAYLDLLTLESQFEELGLDLQQVFNQCLQK